MQKLLKETGIAAVVYFALSFGLGLGLDEGEGWPEAAMSAAIFAVFYFVVGLGIRWFKGRKS
jgi:preprotein translocase subunit SecG